MSDKREVNDLKAIRRVVKHLNREWIVEGCGDYPAKMGCASCEAIDLKKRLQSLACEVLENAGQDTQEVAKW